MQRPPLRLALPVLLGVGVALPHVARPQTARPQADSRVPPAPPLPKPGADRGSLAQCVGVPLAKRADPNGNKIRPNAEPPPLPWPPVEGAAPAASLPQSPVADGRSTASLLGGFQLSFPNPPFGAVQASDLAGEWMGRTRRNKVLLQLGAQGQLSLGNGPLAMPEPRYPAASASLPASVGPRWTFAGNGQGGTFTIFSAGTPQLVPMSSRLAAFNGAEMTHVSADGEPVVLHRSPRYACQAHLRRMHRIWDVATNESRYFPTLNKNVREWEAVDANKRDIAEAAAQVKEQACSMARGAVEDQATEWAIGAACAALAVPTDGAILPFCALIERYRKTKGNLEEYADKIRLKNRMDEYLYRTFQNKALASLIARVAPYHAALDEIERQLAAAYDEDYSALQANRCEMFDRSSNASYPLPPFGGKSEAYFSNLPANEYLEGAWPFTDK